MINTKDETPIEVLNLSVRSYNGLRRNGIKTIRELLKTPREQIESIKGLGNKRLDRLQ